MWITVDRQAELPLIRQVYLEIRRQILGGELKAGEKLPSTRFLAAELQVSRNIVLEAYDLLFAEGYLTSRSGLGTYVAGGAAMQAVPPEMPEPIEAEEAAAAGGRRIDFQSSLPDLRLFPAVKWRRIIKEVLAEPSDRLWGYQPPEGQPELRAVLADHLRRARGVVCRPGQIIITSGAKQGLNIAARCLLEPGGEAWVEDPNNTNIALIFSLCGAAVKPIPVDGQGLVTERLPASGNPAMIYTTPSHQFPLGGVLPIQRRLELIAKARALGAYLIEDDYDSEFRYDGPPVSSMQELAPERVIYAGSFSKTMAPALRLGYLVLPAPLVDRCRELKRLQDLFTNPLNQLATARFIRDGHYARHVYRTRSIYHRRRNLLVQALQGTFGDKVEILGQAAGLHLVARFEGKVFSPAVMAALRDAGLDLSPPVEHLSMVKGLYRRHLMLGYGQLDEAEILAGVDLLKRGLG